MWEKILSEMLDEMLNEILSEMLDEMSGEILVLLIRALRYGTRKMQGSMYCNNKQHITTTRKRKQIALHTKETTTASKSARWHSEYHVEGQDRV